jgi:hypothetical protein
MKDLKAFHGHVIVEVLLRRSLSLTLRATNMGKKSVMMASRFISVRIDS